MDYMNCPLLSLLLLYKAFIILMVLHNYFTVTLTSWLHTPGEETWAQLQEESV